MNTDCMPMIVDEEGLKAFLDQCDKGGTEYVCAVDTEADSLHRYSESLCLVQFSDGRRHVLIDPLAIDDLSSLTAYLRGASCWMHGADYDMHMLRQNLGVIPPVVFDTQIGARLLGVRKFGYGDLVSHYMDVQLEKSSQKADWSKRPLTPVMEEYALNDVVYLLPMAGKIVNELKEKGRYDWFVESCEAARQKSLERVVEKVDRWRIKGSGKLEPRELNLLKALWEWRDAEAAEWDRPSFMVTGNRQILEWVSIILSGGKPFLPKHYRSQRVKRFYQAVEKALAIPEAQMPQRIRGERRRKNPEADARLDVLLAKRNKVAEELDIDGSLIGSRAALEAFAVKQEGAEKLFLDWQRELLGI